MSLLGGSNFIERREKIRKFEEKYNEIVEMHEDSKLEKKKWYQLVSIIIKEAIGRYPQHIGLRVINAFIQKSKLDNEFKAMFEMMNCELLKPTIFEKFVIFRKKIEVEQTLVKQHQKNITRIGTLDVMQVYNYEK